MYWYAINSKEFIILRKIFRFSIHCTIIIKTTAILTIHEIHSDFDPVFPFRILNDQCYI